MEPGKLKHVLLQLEPKRLLYLFTGSKAFDKRHESFNSAGIHQHQKYETSGVEYTISDYIREIIILNCVSQSTVVKHLDILEPLHEIMADYGPQNLGSVKPP